MKFKFGSGKVKLNQFRIDSTQNTLEPRKDAYTAESETTCIKSILESIPSGAVLLQTGSLYFNERANALLGSSEDHPEVFEENVTRLLTLKPNPLPESAVHPAQVEFWSSCHDGNQCLCEVTLPAQEESSLWLIDEITSRRQNERLHHLLTSATSDVTGDEFFKRLVTTLAEALKLKCVLLVKHQTFHFEPGNQRIGNCQTVGACFDGELVPDFEYEVKGTPCADAIGTEPYSVCQNVARHYPEDMFLQEYEIESYFSLPMVDKHGAVQGHLVMLGDRPIYEDLCEIPAIKSYTYRAAAELSREYAERKLKESELRITMAARGSEIGLWDYDVITKQARFDDKWFTMLGYTPGEFAASFAAWQSLVHPEDLPPTLRLLKDYLDGKSPSYEAEIRMKTKAGAWKWILTRGKIAAYSPHQKPVQVIGTHIDIDDLKRSQQIRLQNEARLRIIMEQIPAILWTTDKENHYTSIVGAGLTQLGLQPDEAVGKPIYEFHESEEVSHYMTAMHERTLKGESVRFEQKLQNTILDIHIEPLRNSHEDIIGCIGLAIDVTVRKKTIEQLNRQRILLQTIFHSVTDVMIVTDRSHNIVMCNESIQLHFRCKEADLLGRPIRELVKSEADYQAQFNRVSYPNSHVLKPFILEYLRTDDTSFQGETIITPLRRSDNQITGYIQVIRDITDRIQMEEEKDQLHAQMLHAQKLESLGVLAGGVAHDFNNLLLAILGNTNLALMELQETSPISQNVKNIEIAARHATKICERLLAYSGRRTFVTTTFNLNQIIRETVEILKTIISPNAHIDLNLSKDSLLIHGDTGQIEQVVLNLLTNASEAIQNQKDAGKINVRTGLLELRQDDFVDYYFCENVTPGRFVFFEIEDNGSGMDADCQSKMFDPFFTTKFTGRGLGLAGVSGIIRGHHGGLFVQSAVESGSCFRVILPVSIEAEEEVNTDSSIDPVVPADVGYVLVIDDDKAVCNVVTNVLKRFGFSVLLANSGAQGLEVYERNRDSISVVLLDMTMPGMSGVETLRQLQELQINIPVILTSGLSENDISDQMEGSEIVHFLKKPYKPQKLVNIVSKALLRHQIKDDATGKY